MSVKIFHASKKEKFNLLLVLFSILLCIPFVIFYNLFNKYAHLVVLLVLSIYFIANSDIIKRKKNRNILLVSITIIILLSFYYIYFALGSFNALMIQTVYIILSVSIYIYIIGGGRIDIASRLFVNIILLVSIFTIISYLGSNTGIIPFPVRRLAGYDIGFNYLFGAVSFTRTFYRPQYYFAEPSYLGFFLGFSTLLLTQLYGIKRKRTKLVLVFIAGMLVYSYTFYAAIIIGIIAEWIFNYLKSYLSTLNISRVFFILFITISLIYITQLDKVDNIFKNFETSFYDRRHRAELSLITLRNMTVGEIMLGKGTGFISIDKKRNRAESNSYIRVLVENGIIVLFIYLFIIYYLLKRKPSLLLYTLVALHSVVVLETPFFLLILLLASPIGTVNNSIKAVTY
jgi:hypothetical protein